MQMRFIRLFSAKFLLLFFFPVIGGGPTFIQIEFDEVCITREEAKLHRLINEYRDSRGLSPIPLSLNLTKVAKTHAADLYYNNPHYEDLCNMHSWSAKGDWEPCCYTYDHANAECMWNKPREISNYKGYGYEIVFYMSPVTGEISMASESLDSWKQSPAHNNIIINAGIFSNIEWNAIGIGIYKEYVTVWFGEKTDDEGEPERCEQ